MRKTTPLLERILNGVVLDGECFVWTGGVTSIKGVPGVGYPLLGASGRGSKVYAHRAIYELCHGPIPKGLQIDHLCRNRRCVNPRHLEAVTQAENIRRGNGASARNARKTHCSHGHPYDEANTWISKSGWRQCRECNRIKARCRYLPVSR